MLLKKVYGSFMTQKLLFIFVSFLFFCNFSKAQITTSGIRGTITDQNNSPLNNVSIVAKLTTTNEMYKTKTQANGNYVLNNMKSGGPYEVIAFSTGYIADTITDLYLSLGDFFKAEFVLIKGNVANNNIIVTAALKRKINFGNSISKVQLNTLPTLNRSIQDFTRLTASANGNSFGGANYRYNNLSVDGASLNDAFGFTEPSSGAGGSLATGNPGGLAKTQPLSLEALQEVQVELSPFNVVLGNFTGGSINAITKSGSNTVSGSYFISGRNQNITGKSANAARQKIDKFFDYQTGGSIGGYIKKNKLFYFVAAEFNSKSEPVAFEPGSAASAIPLSVAKAISDTLQKRYNYNSGSFGKLSLENQSTKLFFKLNWDVNEKHKISLRNNYVKAFADYGERSANVLNFESQGFTHNSITNSTILEVRSNFNKSMSNNLIIGYTNTNDFRETNGAFFPHIEITYNTANTIFAGIYREASLYGLTLGTKEITNNFTYNTGKHNFTVGIHNEFYDINYRFLTAFNGRWAYRNINDFYANKPSRIRGAYHLQNNDYQFNKNNPSANFRVHLWSQYIQDVINLNKNLQLTVGLRADFTTYPDNPKVNPIINATKAFEQYKNKIYSKPQLAPRIGFNYDVLNNKKYVIKGGLGIFNGRMPFAWLAYPYYNSGTTYGNVDIRPTTVVPLVSNVATIANNLQPNIREINLLDNNFKLPKVARGSIGFDVKTDNNWTFTLEAIYTKTLQDILYKTINLKDSTGLLVGSGDNRKVYLGNGNQQKLNASFTNVFLLTNTQQGYRYSATAAISKKYKNLKFSSAYTYGSSKDIVNGVRVSPQSNWEFNQSILPNNPQLSASNFDLRHRSVSTIQYNYNRKKSNTNITAVYIAQSGSPFTYTYIGDINRDGSPNNDLIYIPKNINESNLADIKDAAGLVINSAANQWLQLDNFITNDKYLNKRRGKYAERNGARTPWNNQLDIKISHTILLSVKDKAKSISFGLDVFNFSNLISKNWGKQYYVPNVLNSSYQLLTVSKANTLTSPELNFNNTTTTPWQFDPILSRSQGQVSIRYNF